MNAVNATNPMLGIFIFMLGGLAGAVFYLPFSRVKNWAWESYWFVYALVGLVVVPWILAYLTAPNTAAVLAAAPRNEIVYCLVSGAFWGFGGLTFGLMVRYLGVGLGLAMGVGLTSAAGTLIPPVLKGKEAMAAMLATTGGKVSVVAAAVSLAGIVCVGLAGHSKESELPEEEKKKSVAEFDFRKGVIAAIFTGLMSSFMNIGLQGGPSLQKLALTTDPVTSATWAGMPVLVVVLLGGFVVNGGWCLVLNFKNRTLGNYVDAKTPITGNLFFAALAGAIWCMQFVCLKTGEPSMGKTAYIGWAVLMAASIFFSQLLGILMGEWKGTGKKTRSLLAAGLSLLFASSIVAGIAGAL
jgi:L-rhamnose-H+ transport protein